MTTAAAVSSAVHARCTPVRKCFEINCFDSSFVYVESPAEVAEEAQASETPSSDSTTSAEPAAAAEATQQSPEDSQPPPEHISVEDFPHDVGDVVTGRVLFANARGARVAIHGVKGVLGCVLTHCRK